MNKLTIPVFLAATIMVAGAFAFMPVEQASTIHTSEALQASSIVRTQTTLDFTLTQLTGSGTVTFGVAADAGPFQVDQLMICNYSGSGELRLSLNTNLSSFGSGNLVTEDGTGGIMTISLPGFESYCFDIIPMLAGDQSSAGLIQLRGDGDNDVVLHFRDYQPDDSDDEGVLIAYISGVSTVGEVEIALDFGDFDRP